MAVSEKVAKQVREKYGHACAMCYRKTDTLQIHHKQHKGMGGRHGRAQKVSDSVDNLIPLCAVCHGALHGERVIDASGFSCDICPANWACDFSRGPKATGDQKNDTEKTAERMVLLLERKGVA